MPRRKRKNLTPNVSLREQPDGSIRPRFNPGPLARRKGAQGCDLRHPDGRWLTREEVVAWCKARISAVGPDSARAPGVPRESVRDLLEDFLRSGRFKMARDDGGYAPKTFLDYRTKANAIIWRPQSPADRKTKRKPDIEDFALAPAAAITATEINDGEGGGFYWHLRRKRGLTMARGAIMVLSAAYKWAHKAQGWRLANNPCLQLGLTKGAPRVVVFGWPEIARMVEFADHVGEHGLADAILLAFFSAQREGDVLAIDGVGMVDGLVRLVQSKRGKTVEVPQLPPLVRRLEIMAGRRLDRGFACRELVVDDRTGRRFNEHTFRHRFGNLRTRAEAGDAALGFAPMPQLAGKQFRDLRDTMLTLLKRAGVRDNQFAAVSGHSLASLPQVMPHYYAPGAEEAREAMAQVWDYMQAKGIAV